MREDEYRRINNLASTHFWYLGSQDLLDRLVRKYTQIGNLKILDAGCGPGVMMPELGKFGKVKGVDISKQALSLCRAKGLEVKEGTIEKIPFENNSFDLVVCLEVLYHRSVSDVIQAIKEFYRVLKPGGVLILREPAFKFLYRSHDVVVQTQRRFLKRQLTELLVSVGFKLVKVSYNNLTTFFPILWRKIAEKFDSRKEARSDLERLPNLLNSFLLYLIKIENFLLNFFDFPFGSSILIVCKK